MKNTLFLYVTNVTESTKFYAELLALSPVETAPNFALLLLPSGLPVGLWDRDDVRPAAPAAFGGSELGFKTESPEQVDVIHALWLSRGAVIAEPPLNLPFGRSFVALDPDGHRLRVYAVTESS